MNEYSKKAMDCAEKSAVILQESIMNVKTVQSCNGQKSMISKLEALLKKERVPELWYYAWEGIGYGFFMFLIYLFYAFTV